MLFYADYPVFAKYNCIDYKSLEYICFFQPYAFNLRFPIKVYLSLSRIKY